MCRKIYITNELTLGQRPLGWEAWVLSKGEVQEFTSKQLKDIIKLGVDEVYGLVVNKATGELEADSEGFFVTNYMVKSHINSLVPKNPEDCLANLFYIVIGTHKEKNNILYDVVSSRYERTSFTEDKVKTLLEMGIISAGVRLVEDKLEVAGTSKPVAVAKTKVLYESNKSDWSCDEQTFINAYNDYINQGLTSDQVESQLEADYKKEKQEEQSKDNAVIESGDNEQLIPAGHEKYFYVQCGMRIGWNDSAKMGYEAGDYFYVADNGDIYYFSSEADKNSFDSSNPNKAFLFYVEGTGLVGGTTGEVHTTQPTESPTQQPTTEPTTQGGSNESTEQETTSSEEQTSNKRPLSDPSQGNAGDGGGYDPNKQ